MNDVTIRMDEHYDLDATMEAVARERFAMPPEVIAAFRQAAMQGAKHLLNLVSTPEQFQKLSAADQLKVLNMIFDRAYGNTETASSSMATLHKTGQLKSDTDHGRQLSQIEERMKQHDRRFPEMKKAQSARKRSLASSSRNSSVTVNALSSEEEDLGNVVDMPRRSAS